MRASDAVLPETCVRRLSNFSEISPLRAVSIAFSSVSIFSESWRALMYAKSPRRSVESTTTLQMKSIRILLENGFIVGHLIGIE